MKQGILLAVGVFIADQITKYIIAFHVFSEVGYIKVTSFFNLVFVKNTGISFSMFSSASGVGRIALLLGIAGVIVWLCFWMKKEQDKTTRNALAIIIGGAVGNLLDRFTYNGVVDFLDFHVNNYHWPAFNLADSFIFIGAVMIVYQGLMTMKKGQR